MTTFELIEKLKDLPQNKEINIVIYPHIDIKPQVLTFFNFNINEEDNEIQLTNLC